MGVEMSIFSSNFFLNSDIVLKHFNPRNLGGPISRKLFLIKFQKFTGYQAEEDYFHLCFFIFFFKSITLRFRRNKIRKTQIFFQNKVKW